MKFSNGSLFYKYSLIYLYCIFFIFGFSHCSKEFDIFEDERVIKTEDQSISESKEDQSISESKEDQSISENKEDQSISENKEDQSISENKEDQSIPENTKDLLPTKTFTFEQIKSMTPQEIKDITKQNTPSFVNLQTWKLEELNSGQLSEVFLLLYKYPNIAGHIHDFTPEQIQSLTTEHLFGEWFVYDDTIIREGYKSSFIKEEGERLAKKLPDPKLPSYDRTEEDRIEPFVRYFSDEQIKALTLEQLNSFKLMYSKAILPKHIPPWNGGQHTSLYSKAILPKHIPLLSIEQLRAFGIRPLRTLHAREISIETIQSFTPEDMEALNISLLSFDQLRALTPEQIAESEAYRLTPEQVRWLTIEQLQAIPILTEEQHITGGVLSINLKSIQALSYDQIKALTREQIDGLTHEHYMNMSYQQVNELPTKPGFFRHTYDEYFFYNYDDLSDVDKDLIQYFTPKQLTKLSYEQTKSLSVNLLHALTPERIQSMPYYLEFFGEGEVALELFSDLSIAQLRAIPPEQMSKLNSSQYNVLKRGNRLIELTPEQVSYLKDEYFEGFFYNWDEGFFTEEHIYGFSLDTINRALDMVTKDINFGDNDNLKTYHKRLIKRKGEINGETEQNLLLNKITPVCERTKSVRLALADVLPRIPNVYYCLQITNQDLAQIKSLYLNFSHRDREVLKVGDFSGMTNLEELFIRRDDDIEYGRRSKGYNKLGSLPKGIFDHLTSLKTLHLQGQRLVQLPVGIFDHLTSLEELLIHDNSLKELPVGIFSNLKSLKRLSLYNNKFSYEETRRISEELKEQNIQLMFPPFLEHQVQELFEKSELYKETFTTYTREEWQSKMREASNSVKEDTSDEPEEELTKEDTSINGELEPEKKSKAIIGEENSSVK